MKIKHEFWMNRALKIAKSALSNGKIPIGSVLTNENFEIGIGYNLSNLKIYPFLHAEINAIKQGFFYSSNKYLNNCTLYITLEPCFLCLSAIYYSRIKNIIYGAHYTDKLKKNIKNSNIIQIKSTGGILEKESTTLLNIFFKKKINNKHNLLHHAM